MRAVTRIAAALFASGGLALAGTDQIFVDQFEAGGATATIGGTVSGLPTASQLTLRLNDDQTTDLVIQSDGAYVFINSPVAVGSRWSVGVVSSPTDTVCELSNGSGTVPAGGVSNADVSCTPDDNRTLWGQFNWNQADWE